MDPKLRLTFCLGLLAVAFLEGPRAGALLAESIHGPYGSAPGTGPAVQSAQQDPAPASRVARDSDPDAGTELERLRDLRRG